jgi:hypothetical protein
MTSEDFALKSAAPFTDDQLAAYHRDGCVMRTAKPQAANR